MRKIFLIIRVVFLALPIYLTCLQAKKESFSTRYFVIKHWSSKILSMTGFKVEVTGQEKIPDGVNYYISNHEGTLDPVVVMATNPKPLTFISKIENSKIPLVSRCMKLIECICFDRSSLRSSIQMIKDTIAKLNEGKSILIFPEGTRSRSLEMNQFKAGSFKPAYETKATIVPITLVNTYLLGTNQTKINTIKVIYGDPITYEQYKDFTTVELSNKLQAEIAKNIELNK